MMGRGPSQKTRMLVEMAHQVLEDEHPMTLRQLFYRLVSVRVLDNRQADYLRLSRVMTDARSRGEIPFEWMVDRSRPVYEVNAFDNPTQYAEVVKRSYRKNYWQEQPWHVEVWTEKDAILGSIQPVTDEYGVTVRVGRGFLSTTRAHEIAATFDVIEKPIRVLYLGDHDPSGVCIEEDAARRVRTRMVGEDVMSVLGRLLSAEPELFKIERLAIHPEDIHAFGLPPLRIKMSDSRAAAFYRRYGSDCVELDALPPSELRDRLRQAIEERIDRPLWEQAIAVEQVKLASIERIVGDIARLKSGGADATSGGTSS